MHRLRRGRASGGPRGGWRAFPAHGLAEPAENLEPAVVPLGNGGTAFDPVAAIDIANTELLMDCRVVNVSADHAVDGLLVRQLRQRLFEIAEIPARGLELVLRPLDGRPGRQTEQAPHPVEARIDGD